MTDKDDVRSIEIIAIIGHWRLGSYNRATCVQKIAGIMGCSLGTAEHLFRDYRTQGFEYYRTHLRHD